jgi:spore coat polysaccharide biosynthesis predicted glycosyltransferase SpsG
MSLERRTETPGPTILVTDHNGLEAAWIRGARTAGALVASLNDLPKIRYASHLVVNGNLGAERLRYETEPGTRLLLGPRYFFFRDEFLVRGVSRRVHAGVARRLVVSLGAADPANLTQALLEGLQEVTDPLEIIVVVGGAYGHLDSLAEAARASRHPVRIERDLAGTASVFAQGEFAVCGGGSTAYEMARLGVPAVLVILSETQKDAAEALEGAGAAVCAGDLHVPRVVQAIESLRRRPKARQTMAEKASALFDGRGRERVLDVAEDIGDTHPRGSAA